MEYPEEIKNTVINNWNDLNTVKQLYGKEIETLTNWLNDNNNKPVFRHRMWVIKEGYYDTPKCKYCDNKALLNKAFADRGFATTCSVSCSKKSRLKNDAEKYLSDYEWLYNKRVTCNMSKDNIARELNITGTHLVEKWLIKHNINYDARKLHTFDAERVLSDKQWFHKQYFEKGLTIAEIAKLAGIKNGIGSTHRWFVKHGFEARTPNSYKRNYVKVSKQE